MKLFDTIYNYFNCHSEYPSEEEYIAFSNRLKELDIGYSDPITITHYNTSKKFKDPLSSRPSWDTYFLNIADVVATRSEDLYVKHGAVIVKDNKIVSCGYNGLIRGFDHNRIDLKNRDYRRNFMVHAEANSIISAQTNLEGATIYVTGVMCRVCFLSVINSGISRIVCRDRTGSITHSEEDKDIIDILIEQSGIKYEVVL